MSRALEEFWRLYRAGNFFEAHEALEDIWRAAQGAERRRLHGLIHGAVARVHHERGNAEGAARQLVRARMRLNEADARFVNEVAAAIAPSLASLDEAARARTQRLEEELTQSELTQHTSTVEKCRTLED